jgi:hypothetical protein
MNIQSVFGALTIAGVILSGGCATSATEQDFGNSVRHTMAMQRTPPAPAPATEPTLDGERLESVLSVYRTMVGDPTPVVREAPVNGEQGAR